MSLQQLQHIGSELQQYLTLHWRNVATQGESEYHTDAHMEAHGSVCSVRRSAFQTLALYVVGRRAVLDREVEVVQAAQERKQLASTCGNPFAANESMSECGQLGRSGEGREHDNGVLVVVLKEELEKLRKELEMERGGRGLSGVSGKASGKLREEVDTMEMENVRAERGRVGMGRWAGREDTKGGSEEVGILRAEVERLKSERLVRCPAQDVCVFVCVCVCARARACACA